MKTPIDIHDEQPEVSQGMSLQQLMDASYFELASIDKRVDMAKQIVLAYFRFKKAAPLTRLTPEQLMARVRDEDTITGFDIVVAKVGLTSSSVSEAVYRCPFTQAAHKKRARTPEPHALSESEVAYALGMMVLGLWGYHLSATPKISAALMAFNEVAPGDDKAFKKAQKKLEDVWVLEKRSLSRKLLRHRDSKRYFKGIPLEVVNALVCLMHPAPRKRYYLAALPCLKGWSDRQGLARLPAASALPKHLEEDKQLDDEPLSPPAVAKAAAPDRLQALVACIEATLATLKTGETYRTNSSGIKAMLAIEPGLSAHDKLARYAALSRERRQQRKGFVATFFWNRNKRVDDFYRVMSKVDCEQPNTVEAARTFMSALDYRRMRK